MELINYNRFPKHQRNLKNYLLATLVTLVTISTSVVTNSVNASDTDWEMYKTNLVQATVNWASAHIITDGIFKRQEYPHVGAKIWVKDAGKWIENEDGEKEYEHFLKVGDTWKWEWRNIDENTLLQTAFLQVSSTDKNGQSCFYWEETNTTTYSGEWCWVDMPDFWVWSTGEGLQCVEPGNYQVKIIPPKGDVVEHNFQPTEFQAGTIKTLLSPNTIHPEIYTGYGKGGTQTHPGQIGSIGVAVEDNIEVNDSSNRTGQNCGIEMPNVQVKLSNKIEDGTGSHRHFNSLGEEEPGTGRYLENETSYFKDSTEVIFDKEKPTIIAGKTNEFGVFTTKYQPGIYGLAERINIEVVDQNIEAPGLGSKDNPVLYEDWIDIKVPGLVPLDTDEYSYKLVGSFKGSCDTAHNNGPNGAQRMSHYVTPQMKNMIHAMNGKYYEAMGHHLSLNDGSLEFGGHYDAGTDNRLAGCHQSHRKGVDIDINRGVKPKSETKCEDVSGYNLYCLVPRGDFGHRLSRWKILNDIATKEIGLKKADESNSLHYRLN